MLAGVSLLAGCTTAEFRGSGDLGVVIERANGSVQLVSTTERTAIGNDPWKRVVTMQGADHKFYVYTGSIVARETAAPTTAAPVHVFGAGVAEYFDGTSASWKAVRDAA